MAPPIDPQHRDATDKSWHVFECGQERLDIIGDLLGGDHQHRYRERERGVDKRFQSRHLHPAQSEPAQSRQRIQIRRHRRCDLLLPRPSLGEGGCSRSVIAPS